MLVCKNCNETIYGNANFCGCCGAPLKQEKISEDVIGNRADIATTAIRYYEGSKQEFCFRNTIVRVSSGMDAFNYYRKVYRKIAEEQVALLKEEYLRSITNLDLFLRDFFSLYFKHRARLIQLSLDVLFQAGFYDIAPKEFADQHTADFCLCMDDYNFVVNSFNEAIVENQDRKARRYNMLPGMVFRGVGGLIAATAVNIAVNSYAQHDIMNANVSLAQRKAIFSRIDTERLMQRAFIDYWRVFLSLTYRMNTRGLDVWYPNVEGEQRANGLYQNLIASRIPADKEEECLATIVSLHPYGNDYYSYFSWKYGKTEELNRIFEYLDGINYM